MTNSEYLKKLNDNLMRELTRQEGAMPPGFNRKRFALNCVTLIQDMLKDQSKVDKLMTITLESIVSCMMKGAYLGLDFFNGECYAIPYGPSKRDIEDAKRRGTTAHGKMNFQTDYKGEIKLAKKYSKNPIKDIYAKVVRKGDEFCEEVDGGAQRIYFRPQPFSDAEMIGTFAIATFTDGSMIYETMSAKEVESVRQSYSKAPDSDAWKKSTGEMYKKTVLRRLCKLIDLDFDNIEQAMAFNEGGDADFTRASESRPLAIPEKEEPVNVVEQIKNAKKSEPVPAPADREQRSGKQEPTEQEDEFAQFEQQYMADMNGSRPDNYDDDIEMPF